MAESPSASPSASPSGSPSASPSASPSGSPSTSISPSASPSPAPVSDTLVEVLDIWIAGDTIVQRSAVYFPYESALVVTDAGNSANFFLTNLTSAVSDYCVGSFIKFTSGTLINQTRRISSYSGTNFTIGVSSAFTATPAVGTSFIIINQ